MENRSDREIMYLKFIYLIFCSSIVVMKRNCGSMALTRFPHEFWKNSRGSWLKGKPQISLLVHKVSGKW